MNNRTPHSADSEGQISSALSPGECSRPIKGNEKTSILVIETERLSIMRKVLAKTASGKFGQNARITVLCNNQRKKYYLSSSRVDRVIAYPAKGIWSKVLMAYRLLFRTKRSDLTVAVLNGEKQFRKSKILFWLHRTRGRLAFDGYLNSFLVDSSSFKRVFSRKRRNTSVRRRIDVLVFETDGPETLREVIKKTRQKNVIPGARITLFCRNSKAEELASPHIRKIISYPDHSPFKWIKTALPIIFRKHTVIVGVLNGRQRFFFSKLLFCLCRNRHRLVFNGSLDCCFWNRHTYGRIIAQGLRSGVSSPFADNPRRVLVLETAGPETMKQLILIASESKVNPNARITLYCNENRLAEFTGFRAIEKIITYSDKSFREKLSASAKLVFSCPDVVAARFSGGRDFRPMKLLFWLIRTPNKIVFNETLDCFYLQRKTFGMLLFGNKRNLVESYLAACFRRIAKALLFIPRFAYLLAWRGFTLLSFKLKG